MRVPPPIVLVDPIASIAHHTLEHAFCARLADYSGADLADVRQLYGLLSPNIADLVHSPQGWAALARLLLADAQCPRLASVH